MLYDSHTHCRFSGDSEADEYKMADSAIRAGLNGMCFTDHIDFGLLEEPNIFTFDPKERLKSLKKLKEEYVKKLDIQIGVEMGMQPHVHEENEAFLKENEFDFVIGSIHFVDRIDIYYPEYYAGKTSKEALDHYFDVMLKEVKTYKDFDVLGHIDYIIRYIPDKAFEYKYANFSDVIDEILKTVIDDGKGIEINTAGFKYGLGHPNPHEDIIRRFKELGGEILTAGSDAHRPEHVAYSFKKAREIALECGFKYYTVFKNRKPAFVKL